MIPGSVSLSTLSKALPTIHNIMKSQGPLEMSNRESLVENEMEFHPSALHIHFFLLLIHVAVSLIKLLFFLSIKKKKNSEGSQECVRLGQTWHAVGFIS